MQPLLQRLPSTCAKSTLRLLVRSVSGHSPPHTLDVTVQYDSDGVHGTFEKRGPVQAVCLHVFRVPFTVVEEVAVFKAAVHRYTLAAETGETVRVDELCTAADCALRFGWDVLTPDVEATTASAVDCVRVVRDRMRRFESALLSRMHSPLSALPLTEDHLQLLLDTAADVVALLPMPHPQPAALPLDIASFRTAQLKCNERLSQYVLCRRLLAYLLRPEQSESRACLCRGKAFPKPRTACVPYIFRDGGTSLLRPDVLAAVYQYPLTAGFAYSDKAIVFNVAGDPRDAALHFLDKLTPFVICGAMYLSTAPELAVETSQAAGTATASAAVHATAADDGTDLVPSECG